MASCCFFGHREVYEDIGESLERVICDLIERKKVKCFYVGNHGAYDRTVKRKLSEIKERYPEISYYVVLAYLPKKGDEYKKIETIYPEGIERVPKKYAIIYRNNWMIDKSEYVVSYVKYETGGAANFQNIAKRKGKDVINIAEHN